jgi:hypothetical protein
MEKLKSLLSFRNINSFFFKKIDYSFITYYRIAIGILYLTLGILYYPLIIDFYGDNGFISTQFPNLKIILSDISVKIFWSLIILSSVMVIIGFYSRIFLIITLILFQFFVSLDSIVFEGIVHFLKLFSIYLAFLPLDNKLSVRKFIIKKEIKSTASYWPIFLIKLQVILIYLVPSISRVMKKTYNDSTWFLHIFTERFWSKLPVYDWMLDQNVTIGILVTRTIISLELFAFLFLSMKKTRKIYALLLILFHITLILFSKIYLWQITLIVFLSLFFIDFKTINNGDPDE